MIFDSHAHVHDRSFDADREAILARAAAADVGGILTVGCDLADSERARDVAVAYDLCWSLGIHPHEAKDAPSELGVAFAAAIAAAPSPPVAIGETGLDYHYDHSPRPVQRDVMRAQVLFARERRLPVIFHQREAFDDFTALLAQTWDGTMRGVVHCFTGDPAQALRLVDEFGVFLGIGGVVTFKTAAALREAVAAVGLERILLETDCPYLAPVPHRGKRNEPAFIAATAAAVATVLGVSDRTVIERTTANANALFGFQAT
jgi:TatD DNase family protein